ncbi:flagellar protein FlaG [Tumebacillus sp. ITR2]|uniref:Flagellar protein FlaG n=1 Tax=Tumebacillus amylolyticus TaxID=2801339 RepID=A0ABS1J648_9BACL|nr:flagellar protein FlaG [Tumebacillus amylolyticus]
MQVSRTPQAITSPETDQRGKEPVAQPQTVSEPPLIPSNASKSKAEQIEASFNRIQKQLQDMQDTKVQMDYDKDLDRVIVKYSSRTTGEMIHQIPSEQFVEFEKEFVKSVGLLFDKKV